MVARWATNGRSLAQISPLKDPYTYQFDPIQWGRKSISASPISNENNHNYIMAYGLQ